MENELDSYIVKLKLQLENERSKSKNQYAQDYIIQRKKETIPEILQLGMTYEEVKQIKGLPKYIDTMNQWEIPYNDKNKKYKWKEFNKRINGKENEKYHFQYKLHNGYLQFLVLEK